MFTLFPIFLFIFSSSINFFHQTLLVSKTPLSFVHLEQIFKLCTKLCLAILLDNC